MNHLFTIGAYGYDADSFFDALEKAKIDLFLDIRRRRGIRGRDYAFGNAGRLTKELEKRGIAYRHILDLAPQPETRELQNSADEKSGLPKRQRAALAGPFIRDYTHRTLDPFDFDALAEELKPFQRPVLFCVERTPEACHRSLVAARLSKATGVPELEGFARVPVTHLTP